MITTNMRGGSNFYVTATTRIEFDPKNSNEETELCKVDAFVFK